MNTEIDIDVLPSTPRGADPAAATTPTSMACPEIQQRQAERYAAIFDIFVKHIAMPSRASPSGAWTTATPG